MIVPHLFQYDTADRTAAAARRGKKIIVVCGPCGSGKTTIGCEIVRRAFFKESPSLEIVHRRRLVDQFSERLRQFDLPHGMVMRDRSSDDRALIQVASRDTLFASDLRPEAKLVIVDEGRHAASPEFRKLLKHYEDRGAVIILLDATPVMPDGGGLGPWAQELIIAAKVSDLVRQKYLVPVKCYAPDRKLRNGKARRGIAGDLVESWKQFSEQRPTVLFCSRVQHSKDAVEAFGSAGIIAKHVDADTPDDERDEIFDALESGKVQVVSNVGIIKEGVDVPCLGCCQLYMDAPGRVAFLQATGRIMRPFPGKNYGILIDHAGGVFRHGFPDEDTEWTLNGNVDADYAKKHDDGDTPKPLYCKHCQLMFHDSANCPECGRIPSKPPRSIFAPPPVDATNELLTEAERGAAEHAFSREAKVQTWFACLATAKKRNGTFTLASTIYHRKYKEWPANDFPCLPGWDQRRMKISEVYPNFGKGKSG